MTRDHLAQKRFLALESRYCLDGVLIGFEGDEPVRGLNTFESMWDASRARVASSMALLTLNSIFNGRS